VDEIKILFLNQHIMYLQFQDSDDWTGDRQTNSPGPMYVQDPVVRPRDLSVHLDDIEYSNFESTDQ
jgi:hypothetical protein